MFRNSLENLGKSTGECKNKHSEKFQKFLKIFGSLRKSSEVFEKNRKMSESSQNDLPTIFENFRKFSEVFGNVRKTSETLGKFSNAIGILREIFITFQSDTCELKIGFKNFYL